MSLKASHPPVEQTPCRGDKCESHQLLEELHRAGLHCIGGRLNATYRSAFILSASMKYNGKQVKAVEQKTSQWSFWCLLFHGSAFPLPPLFRLPPVFSLSFFHFLHNIELSFSSFLFLSLFSLFLNSTIFLKTFNFQPSELFSLVLFLPALQLPSQEYLTFLSP